MSLQHVTITVHPQKMAQSDQPTGDSSRRRKRRRSEIHADAHALVARTKASALADRQRCEDAYDAAWRAFCRTAWDGPDVAARVFAPLLTDAVRNDMFAREGFIRRLARSIHAVHHGPTRQQELLLLWAWHGHLQGSSAWRLEDVLRVAACGQQAHEETDNVTSVWLSTAIESLVEASEEVHVATASSIMSYLIRVAFTSTASEDQCIASSVAVEALGLLCQPPASQPPRSLVVVSAIIARAICQPDSDPQAVTALRVFLRIQVKHMLAASTDWACTTDRRRCMEEILATFQQCVEPAQVVQLFRQVHSEAIVATSHTTADPMDVLAPLITSCSTRDASFRTHALAIAHDLALEAVNASDAVTFRQSLDLVAAATVPPSPEDDEDSGYNDWFRTHFAAEDAPSPVSEGRASIESLPYRCLRSSPTASTCSMLSSKRHLQFVCAFLAEFDRSDSPQRRASHVRAHLSAIKTHQSTSGSVVAGLLADFCAQTRHRYVELQSKEREAKARLRRQSMSSTHSTVKSSAELSSQASSKQSQYDTTTRVAVDELLEMYTRDRDRLMPTVNQWKIFKPQQWRQQILPCCLDIEYWQGTVSCLDTEASAELLDDDVRVSKRTMALVVFVQLLAKHHAVGTVEYVGFVERVEAWFKRQHKRSSMATRRLSQSNGVRLAALQEAMDHYEQSRNLPKQAGLELKKRGVWEAVQEAFVLAFEELVQLREADKLPQMQAIWEQSARRLATVCGSTRDVNAALKQHLGLWIALLSSETAGDGDATPEERMAVMSTYCQTVVQVASVRIQDTSQAKSMENAVEFLLLGSLLGLLGSLIMCEAIASTCMLQVSEALVVDKREAAGRSLRRLTFTSAFLCGFIAGFTKNPTDAAPQTLVLRMLPPQLHVCLVWTAHHARVWWSDSYEDEVLTEGDQGNRPLWQLVGSIMASVYTEFPWFRLTCSPGVLTTAEQWHTFWKSEWICCCLAARTLTTDTIACANRQLEQIEMLALGSAAGQSARISAGDLCVWAVEVVILVAQDEEPKEKAQDVLVLLLKDLCHRYGPDVQVYAIIQLILASVGSQPTRQVIHQALRCMDMVLMADEFSAPVGESMARASLFKQFFDAVVTALHRQPTAASYDWIRALWCILVRVPYAADAFASLTSIPSTVFAHWAFELPRLIRLPRAKSKVHRLPACSQVIKAVQACHTFYSTLGVRRLTALPPSAATFSITSSQYSSQPATDGSLLLHVRSLEWLIVRDLISTPSIGTGGGLIATASELKTTLAFHAIATRVLLALLEDVSISRPGDVALELAEICAGAWSDSTGTTSTMAPDSSTSFKYQLLLIHMVAELSARHGTVSRHLSRAAKTEDVSRRVFLTLVLHASSETEQLDTVLAHSGSTWVNTVAAVACYVARSTPQDTSRTPLAAMLQPLAAFRDLVASLLSRVLSFAATHQIDLLDASVLESMETSFPSLKSLIARVPVMNLASGAYDLASFE